MAEQRYALFRLRGMKPWVFACRRVTFWQQRQKVTKKRRLPTTAPSYRRSRSAIGGCPALLACVGVQRQAIPGLTLDASASCLASRQTGASQGPTQAAMLGAVTGKRQRQNNGNVKSHSSFPRKRESRGRRDGLRYLCSSPRIRTERRIQHARKRTQQ